MLDPNASAGDQAAVLMELLAKVTPSDVPEMREVVAEIFRAFKSPRLLGKELVKLYKRGKLSPAAKMRFMEAFMRMSQACAPQTKGVETLSEDELRSVLQSQLALVHAYKETKPETDPATGRRTRKKAIGSDSPVRADADSG